jgi:hypothetical protein
MVNAGAALGGSGTSQGNVINNGTLAPGNSVGTFHIGGNYNQSAVGHLEIELASLASRDELTITGTASLAGTLAVSILGGYTPQAGDMYEIMTAAGFAGTKFTTSSLPTLTGGLSWTVNYGTSAITLSISPPGDFNRDLVVDAADYVVWRKNPGGSYTPDDYTIWRANFGQTFSFGNGSSASVGSPSSAVPEPASALVLLLLGAAAGMRRASRVVSRVPSTS